MSTSSTLAAVTQALAVVNTLITLSGNSKRFRAMVAKAVEEGRTLSSDELNSLQGEAQDAVDRLGEHAVNVLLFIASAVAWVAVVGVLAAAMVPL